MVENSKRTLREWTSTFPVFLLLFFTLLLNISEMGYSQYLKLGSSIWPDYQILRGDIPTPACNPNQDIESELARLINEQNEEADEFDFFDDEPVDDAALRTSLEKQLELCRQKHTMAQQNQANVTTGVRAFRTLDYALLKISQLWRENQQLVLALVIFICAFTTSLTRHHIGLRSMTTRTDNRLGAVGMLIANSLITYSAVTYLRNGYASGLEMQHPETRWAYVIGFGIMSLISLYQCFKLPKDAPQGDNTGTAGFLQSIPLYCYLAIATAFLYLFVGVQWLTLALGGLSFIIALVQNFRLPGDATESDSIVKSFAPLLIYCLGSLVAIEFNLLNIKWAVIGAGMFSLAIACFQPRSAIPVLIYCFWAFGALILSVFNVAVEMVVTFGTFALILALFQTFKSIGKSFLSIPLYCYMAFVAANFYMLGEDNPQGVILFIDRIMNMGASMFLTIGLYIWVGMMLKQTNLGELVFRVFTPWKLPPELLAFLAVAVLAVPTAYTGASGVIVIAMGAVVYGELRKAGARRQLALAATAMSGSLGVVLRPCLLVVIIAALNKEVTTDQLFSWGVKVFLLTSFLFFLISLFAKQGPMRVASPRQALGPSLAAFKPLIPYVIIFVVTAVFFAVVMDAHLDEFSAPTVLPVIILLILAYERFFSKGYHSTYTDKERGATWTSSVKNATTESTLHIGALLILIGLSMAVGGVIEDSHIIQNAAEQGNFFQNAWQTAAILVVILVIIGMSMDPFGAVILVSGTIAQVAYQKGIDPIHFWMMTLVAFELGYLSPPVALNHLLTRQVVGEDEVDKAVAEVRDKGIWKRYERILLPITVMGIALLLVAFLPLIIGYSN